MITQATSTSTTASPLLAPLATLLPIGRRSLYALGLALRLAFFVGLVAHSMTLLNRW